jgi:hypothetical protein
MKKMLCGLALAVASFGIAVPTAQADTPRCVTKGEYRQVHRNTRMPRVHRVFDVRGRRVAYARVGRFTSEVRVYRTCRRGGAVSVSYGNRRLKGKFAIWRPR